MTVLIIAASLLWSLSLGIMLLGTYWALKGMLSKSPPRETYPPLSILKPIKGLEQNLEDNLNSFLKLDYPNYELVLCLEDEKDPAYTLLSLFVKKHPSAQLRLHIGAKKVGPNPKVNNLMGAYEQTQHDLILISDSNVRVTGDYLKKMVNRFEKSVGVVTSVVVGKGANQFGGELESIFLNTFYARWMWICKKLGSPAVIGKSMLFSRKEAQRFGGLETLSLYIAEDYMAGQAFEKLGLKVEICFEPVTQWIGDYSFKDFWKRHLRWGRIRRAQSPILTLFEPIFFSTVSLFFGAYAIQQSCPNYLVTFICIHILTWTSCDLLLLKVENTLTPRALFAWMIREVLAIPLFIHTCCSSTVNWRGNPLKIKTGGLVTHIA